ncbi:hypothetical protein [Aquimarina litoralis]|uniref:hypothetical protein n=1 Tax=Aquimarina litoralis TaxID=584605 RepID=UPI001C560354|nr:hypothetical protein [Aquimarina litoralis]MBW1299039.1 hypothetical protein [Aquimarina litoralis]
MKSQFIYVFGTMVLMFSCKNSTPKNIEILNNQAEIEIESVQIKSQNKTDRPCDLRTLKEIDSLLKQKERLNEQNYLKFIVGMRTDCDNNIEYSQWNNELIFRVLQENPKMFIAFLSRLSRKIKSNQTTDFVLEELKSPTHDGIEINKLKVLIMNTQTEDKEIKREILKSLTIAEEKLK